MHSDHHQGSKRKGEAKVSCPTCGRTLRERELDLYQYKESGLDNVVLRGGVTEAVCPERHDSLISVQAEPQLLQVIALTLLMRRGFLGGKEIRFARETCDLTQAELAKAMRLGRRETIAEWENEKSPRRDLAGEFLLRAVLLGEFKQALELRVPNYLSPSHFDLLHSFQEVFAEAYRILLISKRKRAERKILVRKAEGGAWTPELDAA